MNKEWIKKPRVQRKNNLAGAKPHLRKRGFVPKLAPVGDKPVSQTIRTNDNVTTTITVQKVETKNLRDYSVAINAKRFTYNLSPSNEEAYKFLTNSCNIFKVNLKEGKPHLSHPRGHMMRQHFTIKAMEFGYAKAKTFSEKPVICSVYGSQRDHTLANYLDHGHVRPEASNHFDFINYRPIVVARDFSKYSEQDVTDLPRADCYIIIDVYANLFEIIERCIDLNPAAVILWSGHLFVGEYGEEMCESGWYRKDGLIHWRSDDQPGTIPYAPHQPNDWLWEEDSYHEWTWTSLYEPGITTKKLLWFHKGVSLISQVSRPVGLTIVKNLNLEEGVVARNLRKLKCACLSKWNERTPEFMNMTDSNPFHSGKVVVDAQLYDALVMTTNHVNFNAWTRDQCFKKAFDDWHKLRGKLSSLFPANPLFLEIINNTANAVYFGRVRDKHELVDWVDMFNPKMAEFNIAKKSIGKPSPVPGRSSFLFLFCLMILILAVLGYLIIPKIFSQLMAEIIFQPYNSLFLMASNGVGTLSFIAFCAYLEELLKLLPHGIGIVLVSLIESYCLFHLSNFKHLSFMLVVFIFRFVIHYGLTLISQKNLALGVFVHTTLNVFIALLDQMNKQYNMYSVYKDYYNHYYGDNPQPEYKEDEHVGLYNFSENLAIVREQARLSYMGSIEYCPILKVVTDSLLDEDEFSLASWVRYLPNSIPIQKPGRSYFNLMQSVQNRICRKAPLDPILQAEVWRSYDWTDLFPIWEESVEWETYVDEWISHFVGFKKKRAQQGVIDALENRLLSQCKVFTKTDEVLRWTADGIKVRAVTALDATMQALTGPVISRLTAIVKDIYNDRWERIPLRRRPKNYSFYVKYCGAATDHNLTQWRSKLLNKLHHGDVGVFIAGDDVALWRNWRNQISAYEFDASMFDQSLSEGPLNFEMMFLEHLGAPLDFIELLRGTFSAKIKGGISRSGMSANVQVLNTEMRPQRRTGGADTSLGNFIDMLAICYYSTMHSLDLCPAQFNDSFKEAAKNLGIILKGGLITLGSESFLKGMWYATNQGEVWGPLPSKFMKLGKAYKDPRCVLNANSGVQLTFEEACRHHASEVANTYKAFLQVPIVRGYVDNYSNPSVVPLDIESWKVQSSHKYTSCEIEEEETGRRLLVRYSVEYDVFLEIEELYRSSKMFQYIAHPAMYKIVSIDY